MLCVLNLYVEINMYVTLWSTHHWNYMVTKPVMGFLLQDAVPSKIILKLLF